MKHQENEGGQRNLLMSWYFWNCCQKMHQEEMKWYNSKMKQRLSYLQAKMLSGGQTEEETSEIITQRL